MNATRFNTLAPAVDMVLNDQNSKIEIYDIVVTTYDDDYVHISSLVDWREWSFDSRDAAADFVADY